MEGYGTDSEQIEALKSWWRKNGRYVVTGLVIAALVIGGWRLWDYWQERQASAAAHLYATVVLAEQKGDLQAIVKNAHTVLDQYPDTAYAALAGLALAKAEFVQQHYAKADAALTRIVNHPPDQGFASIARLRLARIQLQQGDAQAALSTLDATKIAQAFAVSAATLRGQAYLALNRIDDARVAWRTAQAMIQPGSGRYQLLAMRLAGLPATTSVQATKPLVNATPKQTVGKAQTTSTSAVSTGAMP